MLGRMLCYVAIMFAYLGDGSFSLHGQGQDERLKSQNLWMGNRWNTQDKVRLYYDTRTTFHSMLKFSVRFDA